MFRQIISAALKVSIVGPAVVPFFFQFSSISILFSIIHQIPQMWQGTWEELAKAYWNVKFVVQK
jgi:hypothetical protein